MYRLIIAKANANLTCAVKQIGRDQF